MSRAAFFSLLVSAFPCAVANGDIALTLDGVTTLSPGFNLEAMATLGDTLFASEIISDQLIRLEGTAPYAVQDFSLQAGQFFGIAIDSASTAWVSSAVAGNFLLRRMDIIDGGFLGSGFLVPQGTYGLAWMNDLLYATNFAENKIFIYNSSGDLVNSFSTPATDTREIITDGTRLFAFDQDSDLLYQLDPLNGTILDSGQLPFFNGGVAQAMAFDQNGDLLVYGLTDNSIYLYNTAVVPAPGALLLGVVGFGTVGCVRRWHRREGS